ncbi:MAG TPA: hypothetical protein VJT83_07205 [Chitinophagaceae bacterium]|nr:hypothetical protein [Chitinophagaceae bacterium]
MKKQFLVFLSAALLLAACSGSSKKTEVTEESKDGTTTETTKEESGSSTTTTTSLDESQKRVDELKKIPPLTNDEMKALFPQEVMGMKRKSFSVNSAMGYASGEATYELNDSTHYKVTVFDCAGEAGAGFYGMKVLAGMNIEREDDNGYEKTINFKGSKAWESYRKNNNEYTLNLLDNERFWVAFEGENTGLDNLKTFANSFNFKK